MNVLNYIATCSSGLWQAGKLSIELTTSAKDAGSLIGESIRIATLIGKWLASKCIISSP
jgi:hypothetical protein